MSSKPLDRLAVVGVAAGAIDFVLFAAASWLAQLFTRSTPLSTEAQQLNDALLPLPVTVLMRFGIPVFAAALVATGVLLLREHPLGVRVAKIWSITALVFLVALTALHVIQAWPVIDAIEAARRARGDSDEQLRGLEMVRFAAIRLALIRAPYPILLLRRLVIRM